MTRMLRTALLATVLMAVAAPTALADSTRWDDRTLNCSHGLMTSLVPPSEFRNAFVPFHDATSGAVLVPFTVKVNGVTYESKALAAKHADRLVSCSYTDRYGWFIEIVGFLTPAS